MAELTLELIQGCFQSGDIVCYKTLLHPKTASFLRAEQKIWDKREKQFFEVILGRENAIAEFITKFDSREIVERDLGKAKIEVNAKQDEYNAAEVDFNKAKEAYNAFNNYIVENNYINALQNEISAIEYKLNNWNRCDCEQERQDLQKKLQGQKKALEEAKKNLEIKLSDKTTREGIKNQLQIELEDKKAIKVALENDLNKWNQEEIDLAYFQKEFNVAKMHLARIQNTLEQLYVRVEEINQIYGADLEIYADFEIIEKSHVDVLVPEYDE